MKVVALFLCCLVDDHSSSASCAVEMIHELDFSVTVFPPLAALKIFLSAALSSPVAVCLPQFSLCFLCLGFIGWLRSISL